jgi:hypothetical protein
MAWAAPGLRCDRLPNHLTEGAGERAWQRHAPTRWRIVLRVGASRWLARGGEGRYRPDWRIAFPNARPPS